MVLQRHVYCWLIKGLCNLESNKEMIRLVAAAENDYNLTQTLVWVGSKPLLFKIYQSELQLLQESFFFFVHSAVINDKFILNHTALILNFNLGIIWHVCLRYSVLYSTLKGVCFNVSGAKVRNIQSRCTDSYSGSGSPPLYLRNIATGHS